MSILQAIPVMRYLTACDNVALASTPCVYESCMVAYKRPISTHNPRHNICFHVSYPCAGCWPKTSVQAAFVQQNIHFVWLRGEICSFFTGGMCIRKRPITCENRANGRLPWTMCSCFYFEANSTLLMFGEGDHNRMVHHAH